MPKCKNLNDGIPLIEFDPSDPQPCGELIGAVKSFGPVYGIRPIRSGKHKHRVEVTINPEGKSIMVHPTSIVIRGREIDPWFKNQLS